GAKADLYDEEKDWDRVGLPVDVMCKIPGYPLLDFVNDKLSAVNVNGLGASKTSNWRQMMLGKIRDQSKNPGVIDNSTAHSLLCDVYDECIYHFATTEFTYSMRFQSADNFINEDYFEAKSLHCENPFESRSTTQLASATAQPLSIFNGAERVSQTQPARLVETYFTCDSVAYQSPTTALGAAATVAGGAAALVVTVVCMITAFWFTSVQTDQVVVLKEKYTDNEINVALKILAIAELEHHGGLRHLKRDVLHEHVEDEDFKIGKIGKPWGKGGGRDAEEGEIEIPSMRTNPISSGELTGGAGVQKANTLGEESVRDRQQTTDKPRGMSEAEKKRYSAFNGTNNPLARKERGGSAGAAGAAGGAGGAGGAKALYEMEFDDAHKRPYWVDKKTGESTWDKPAGWD
ncbi:hypothetical protein TeGR_g11320, partial [Tetraparma gracilis]